MAQHFEKERDHWQQEFDQLKRQTSLENNDSIQTLRHEFQEEIDSLCQ